MSSLKEIKLRGQNIRHLITVKNRFLGRKMMIFEVSGPNVREKVSKVRKNINRFFKYLHVELKGREKTHNKICKTGRDTFLI